ncbi:MAG: hypothetical protein EZS28_010582 [Streblomastix strix]|uniref:intramembrane prenyl-peptidase Rce1 n=1 Tax=Streblomastix strix TaxID=222440 RepID=A0A5J4WFW8_9EUKA|nr:MAG: hypothetical protein EZS28_010582 [Streblomastix strix]
MGWIFAIFLGLIPAFVYVLSIYLWYPFVGEVALQRDSQEQKKRRLCSATACAIASCILCLTLGVNFEDKGIAFNQPCLHLLSIVKSAIATVVLFAGPLIQGFVYENLNAASVFTTFHYKSVLSWNAYIISPILEEIVFRGQVISIVRHVIGEDEASVIKLMISSTIIFVIAHAHHLLEKEANLMQTVGQLFISSLFGALSSFLFIRTRSVLGPIISHIFCNLHGPPPIQRIRNINQVKKYGHFILLG